MPAVAVVVVVVVAVAATGVFLSWQGCRGGRRAREAKGGARGQGPGVEWLSPAQAGGCEGEDRGTVAVAGVCWLGN